MRSSLEGSSCFHSSFPSLLRGPWIMTISFLRKSWLHSGFLGGNLKFNMPFWSWIPMEMQMCIDLQRLQDHWVWNKGRRIDTNNVTCNWSYQTPGTIQFFPVSAWLPKEWAIVTLKQCLKGYRKQEQWTAKNHRLFRSVVPVSISFVVLVVWIKA